jgi:hypothetical protein
MATLENLIEWISTTTGIREAADAGARDASEEEFQVRALPNEDIFFYVRAIDNSRVMPQAEPRSTRAALKSIAASLACVTALILLLLPAAWNVHAGYQIHRLELEHAKLLNDAAVLEQQEAALVSPERLAELSQMQALVDPAPEELVPLPPSTDGTWAKR